MFFFFKQKTAYDMRISDWSSDVCSSDLSSRSANRGISLLPQIAFTAGQPTQTSRRRCFDAQTMPRAAISGWKIGGTGCARRGMCERAQSNRGVLKAEDRQSRVEGKRVRGRVNLGGRRSIQTKKTK